MRFVKIALILCLALSSSSGAYGAADGPEKRLRSACFVKVYGEFLAKFSYMLEERTMNIIEDQTSEFPAEKRLQAFEKARFKMSRKVCDTLGPQEFSDHTDDVEARFDHCVNYRTVQKSDYQKGVENVREAIFDKTDKGEKVESSCAQNLLHAAEGSRRDFFHRNPNVSCKSLVEVINSVVDDCRNEI